MLGPDPATALAAAALANTAAASAFAAGCARAADAATTPSLPDNRVSQCLFYCATGTIKTSSPCFDAKRELASV